MPLLLTTKLSVFQNSLSFLLCLGRIRNFRASLGRTFTFPTIAHFAAILDHTALKMSLRHLHRTHENCAPIPTVSITHCCINIQTMKLFSDILWKLKFCQFSYSNLFKIDVTELDIKYCKISRIKNH